MTFFKIKVCDFYFVASKSLHGDQRSQRDPVQVRGEKEKGQEERDGEKEKREYWVMSSPHHRLNKHSLLL